MLGISLEKADIDAVIYGLKMERYQLAAEYLEDAFRPLLERISVPPEGQPFNVYAELLKIPYQVLSTVEAKLMHQLSHLLRRNLQKLRSVISTLLDFEHQENLVCYAEESQGSTRLCATLYDLDGPMKKLLWNRPQGVILTSGTMAVGTDFQRFRTDTGLTDSYRVTESVWESPFDYLDHALLYLPEYPPLQFGGRQDLYYDALAGEIARLIRAASGHTLVLFTSYSAMSAVKERLLEQGTFYPLLAMGHNPSRTMQQFQAMPGAVLLATGSAWEGMDFPGDMVSLLVIPKLPFPYGIAILEEMMTSVQRIRSHRMLWSEDVVELNKRISDLSSQNQMLTRLNQQGLIDSDIFIYQSNELAQQLQEVKVKKKRLLERDEDTTTRRTQELVEILENGPEKLDLFHAEYFHELIERVIVDCNTQIRFRLKNGLELSETIERTVR